jgi:hypothetical protein
MAARFVTLAALLLTIGSAACATDVVENEEAVGETEGAITSKSLWLKYEGTCEFLRSCSRWSRGLPEGNVLWGCSAENTASDDTGRDYGACSDDDLWVAGPTRAYCGKTAKICKGNVCVNAKVKDISVSKDWEASNGVMAALGLPFGLSASNQCSGFGGGKVKVTSN